MNSSGRFPAVGITGGVGCGKSEAGRWLEAHGVAVTDADREVHRLLGPGGGLVDAVVREFGPDVRDEAGGVRRDRVAERVFADGDARRRLEALVHPPVIAAIRDWVAATRAARPCAGLVPLLFEVGLTDPWDAVVCIAAADAVVDERLAARGWDAARIAARRAAQWPLAEKMKRADVVIRNDGTRDDFAEAMSRFWNELQERRRDSNAG